MPKKKKRGRKKNPSTQIMIEEEYDAYMADIYGFEYIAGYTDSGVPYGIPQGEEETNKCIYDYNDDKIPF